MHYSHQFLLSYSITPLYPTRTHHLYHFYPFFYFICFSFSGGTFLISLYLNILPLISQCIPISSLLSSLLFYIFFPLVPTIGHSHCTLHYFYLVFNLFPFLFSLSTSSIISSLHFLLLSLINCVTSFLLSLYIL